jgi:hypothetical protein
MSDPDVTTILRDTRRRRRVPVGATCATCGETRHLRLYADGRVLCYGCRQAERGAAPTEVDHVAGHANLGGLTVALLANDHRTVTELRLRLGLDAWPPADGDPLLVLAHLLAGVGTILILVAEWLVEHARAVAGQLAAPTVGSRPFPVVP